MNTRSRSRPWDTPGTKPHLRLSSVAKSFGTVRAVDNISLDIYPGEFFALLGPSGCGKTTLLRMLAGFETPETGQILLDGQDLAHVPPHERPVNMMFQSYALFPHMSVAKNIAFGLQMKGISRADIKTRVDEMLTLTQLGPLANRRPAQLSGGQRQRVALARALALKPKLLLLDEPLGALDRKLREATQFELMKLQQELGLTFVIVTHDQEEAMTVSSRIAVMREGRIAQLGEPRQVYEAPRSRYVAEFLGDVNILSGKVTDAAGGSVASADGTLSVARALDRSGTVEFALRPEKIVIAHEDASGPNTMRGRVEDTAYLGDVSVYHVRTDSGALVKATMTNRARATQPELSSGDAVGLSWAPDALVELMPD